MDNIGLYTEGQEGLFHVKLAHTRMLSNEYWGKPNARSPWSLWKINTLLGRKPISVGWKCKSAPPFRPCYELMLVFALPANIIDGFRLFCGKDSLELWIKDVKSVSDVNDVAVKVLENLCSARRVMKLRELKPSSKRDIPLENICLFIFSTVTVSMGNNLGSQLSQHRVPIVRS